MYIKRHIEPVVARIAKRKPVLVLTGARQVGKSTMLKEVYHDINYIALNRPLVRQSAKDNPSLFFDTYKPPVIVDEKKIKGQFYLTGSQSFDLMEGISDSLAGRAGIIKLMGLSLREVSGIAYREPFAPTEKHFTGIGNGTLFDYDALIRFVHKGSFPELYETESDLHDWSDFFNSYFETYIERDVRDALKIQDESASAI